jgi:hypothetical protein
MARPQPDCAVELLGGWNPIESLRFVKGHRRSLPGMILAIAFLLLAVVSITSLIAHPAESAQIVLTGRSAIQVVDISSGVIKIFPGPTAMCIQFVSPVEKESHSFGS